MLLPVPSQATSSQDKCASCAVAGNQWQRKEFRTEPQPRGENPTRELVLHHFTLTNFAQALHAGLETSVKSDCFILTVRITVELILSALGFHCFQLQTCDHTIKKKRANSQFTILRFHADENVITFQCFSLVLLSSHTHTFEKCEKRGQLPFPWHYLSAVLIVD